MTGSICTDVFIGVWVLVAIRTVYKLVRLRGGTRAVDEEHIGGTVEAELPGTFEYDYSMKGVRTRAVLRMFLARVDGERRVVIRKDISSVLSWQVVYTHLGEAIALQLLAYDEAEET